VRREEGTWGVGAYGNGEHGGGGCSANVTEADDRV